MTILFPKVILKFIRVTSIQTLSRRWSPRNSLPQVNRTAQRWFVETFKIIWTFKTNSYIVKHFIIPLGRKFNLRQFQKSNAFSQMLKFTNICTNFINIRCILHCSREIHDWSELFRFELRVGRRKGKWISFLAVLSSKPRHHQDRVLTNYLQYNLGIIVLDNVEVTFSLK